MHHWTKEKLLVLARDLSITEESMLWAYMNDLNPSWSGQEVCLLNHQWLEAHYIHCGRWKGIQLLQVIRNRGSVPIASVPFSTSRLRPSAFQMRKLTMRYFPSRHPFPNAAHSQTAVYSVLALNRLCGIPIECVMVICLVASTLTTLF
jgi:hypothetical protein